MSKTHPEYYKDNNGKDLISEMAERYSLEAYIGFCRGNIEKYVRRFDGKNGIEDLEKAKVYIDRLIEGLKKYEKRNAVSLNIPIADTSNLKIKSIDELLREQKAGLEKLEEGQETSNDDDIPVGTYSVDEDTDFNLKPEARMYKVVPPIDLYELRAKASKAEGRDEKLSKLAENLGKLSNPEEDVLHTSGLKDFYEDIHGFAIDNAIDEKYGMTFIRLGIYTQMRAIDIPDLINSSGEVFNEAFSFANNELSFSDTVWFINDLVDDVFHDYRGKVVNWIIATYDGQHGKEFKQYLQKEIDYIIKFINNENMEEVDYDGYNSDDKGFSDVDIEVGFEFKNPLADMFKRSKKNKKKDKGDD